MAGFGDTSSGDILSSLGVLSQLPRDTGNTPYSLIPQIIAALGSMGPVAPTGPELTNNLGSQPVAPPETAIPAPPTVPPGGQPLVVQPGMMPGAAIGAAVGANPPPVIPPPEPPPPVGPQDFNQFPGGSLLQNLGIQLPGTTSLPQGVPVEGLARALPHLPRASLPPPTRPDQTPVLGPEPAEAGGDRRSDGGRSGGSRLLDTLAVIGSVLSQPIPPGGNAVSQIGKAMGLGFVYNKMLDTAEQDQQNLQKKQELEARRTGVSEAQLGLTGRRVAAEERMTDAQIMALGERVKGTQLENRFKEIELQFKNDPARRAMELRKLSMEVDNLGARTDLARSQTATPDDKRAAQLVKALKDGGALDSMNPDGIDWRRAAPIYSTYGYKPLGAGEVAQAKAQYQKLIQGGMQPIEAERQINLWLTSPERKRAPISLATPTR